MSPASQPLSFGQISSINDDKGPTVVVVTSVLIGLSTVTVALRFTARASRHMKFSLDDWMSIGALVVHPTPQQ